MPSAGGFVQLSACVNANAEGVVCAPPNQQLFATGMNGDEDLGQDIIMKGKPFHYNQEASFVQIAASPVSDEAEKVSVLQTPIAGTHTSFYAQRNWTVGESEWNKNKELISNLISIFKINNFEKKYFFFAFFAEKFLELYQAEIKR